MMPYATRQQVRDFGVPLADATDARVDSSLLRADIRINSYTGKTFAAAASRTEIIDGVYKGTIPLPAPFSAVTAVTIDGIALATPSYEVRSWGLQLFSVRLRDGDGFPLYWSAVKMYPRIAATVKVTATFGEIADAVIVEAATMLASQFARQNADDALPVGQIKSYKSGGVSITQSRVEGRTTGNLEVDAMLDDYLYGGAMVN